MGESVRSPFLDQLLQLAPIEPGSGLRILELDTERQGGASAFELAARAGGSVVSVSASTKVIGAARSARGRRSGRVAFHAGPVARGWPAGAPYDLVLSWPVMDRVPHAWVVQCAPAARLVVPIWLPRPNCAPGMGVVRLTLNRQGLLNWPPHLATFERNPARPGSPRWLISPAVPDSNQDSYGFSCGCPTCLPPADLAELGEPVTTGDHWVRPIAPTSRRTWSPWSTARSARPGWRCAAPRSTPPAPRPHPSGSAPSASCWPRHRQPRPTRTPPAP